MEREKVKGKAAGKDTEFFDEGLEKYLDALSAVTMFEREFQRRVKEAVTRHQPALSELFGGDWRLRDFLQSSNGLIPDSRCLEGVKRIV